MEEGLGGWWVVRVKVGRQNCLSNGVKGQQSQESYSQPKGVGKGDFPSLWAVPPRDLQKTNARKAVREGIQSPPKALGLVPQIRGPSLVTDLSQNL